jgi:succinate dehydrogenase/fumarate reductase cytochrome b subunit
MDRPGKLARTLHLGAAIAVGLYALVHVVNHLVALQGMAPHIAFMRAVRQVTRVPVVEALLLAAVAVQVGSGLLLVLRRRQQRLAQLRQLQRRPPFDRLQEASGLYVAFFLLVHVVSLLFGRAVLGLDTNFYFAAAGLQVKPYPLFFVPYYGLAVAALFTHLACVLRRRLPAGTPLATRDRAAWAAMAAGAVLAVLIVASFSGVFYPVDLPPAYLATFR